MQILVLAPYLPFPPEHGGRIRSAVLLRALAAVGEVQLLAPLPGARSEAEDWARGAGVQLQALPAAASPRPSLRRKLGCWRRGRSELLARRWLPESRRVVAELLQRTAFDLVVADSSYVLPLLPAASVPLLLHLHNVESALFGRDDGVRRGLADRWQRRLEAVLLARAEGEAAARAALTVTVSELDRQRILALAPLANAHCVDNSIDLERRPLLPPRTATPLRLLFVGSFDYPPNVEAARELVLQHLPALRAAFPGACVRLVGADEGGALRTLAGEGVEVVGRAADLLPHYRDSDAVYLPIRSGGGTRIKVLEAFAFGRPVLATQVGVEGLGVGEGRHYLGCEDGAQGVASVRRLAQDGAAIVAAARQLVEQRFGDEAAVQRLQQLVREHGRARPQPATAPRSLLRRIGDGVGRPLGALWLLRW